MKAMNDYIYIIAYLMLSNNNTAIGNSKIQNDQPGQGIMPGGCIPPNENLNNPGNTMAQSTKIPPGAGNSTEPGNKNPSDPKNNPNPMGAGTKNQNDFMKNPQMMNAAGNMIGAGNKDPFAGWNNPYNVCYGPGPGNMGGPFSPMMMGYPSPPQFWGQGMGMPKNELPLNPPNMLNKNSSLDKGNTGNNMNPLHPIEHLTRQASNQNASNPQMNKQIGGALNVLKENIHQ